MTAAENRFCNCSELLSGSNGIRTGPVIQSLTEKTIVFRKGPLLIDMVRLDSIFSPLDGKALDGKDCVDSEEARQLLRHVGIEAGPEIELGPTHYRCIAHHSEVQVLVFTPVVGRERRLVVLLGPVSDEPRIVLLQWAGDGNWVDLLDSGAYLL